MIEDDFREAEKNRLSEKANQSRKIRNRQWLAKMANRFGLFIIGFQGIPGVSL
jgi:hypothetical protein